MNWMRSKMNWYNQYKFAQNKDPYGYWLSPEGQLLNVDNQSHLNVLNDLGYQGGTEDKYEKAARDGYIRLVVPNNHFTYKTFNADFDIPPNTKQISVLENLIDKAYGKYRNYVVFKIYKLNKCIYNGSDPRKAKMSLFQ